jgi:hypothetical protein
MSNLHYEYLKDYLTLCDEYLKEVSAITWETIPQFNFEYDGGGDREAAEEAEDNARDEYYEKWGLDEDPKRFAKIARRIADEWISDRLTPLNARYVSLGLEKSLLRIDFPMRPAIDQSSCWYNSSCW